MFVRKKKNKSGSTSIQIISKEHGAYRVIKSLGCSKDPNEIEQLVLAAQRFIDHPSNQAPLFPTITPEDATVQNFVDALANAQIRTIGPELIFGQLFDAMGFNQIPDELFRHITIARLAFPTSKLKTVDYLYRYRGLHVEVDAVYRFLDRLQDQHKETVEHIAFEHTKKILKNISVVFYDMTTLYFEAEDEDDLRKIGFSKDGKFQKPQIMLGLLVGQGGLPIGYDIFQGNTFEGHTLLPVLEKIKQKYSISEPTVVADAALLSKKNLENLAEQDYRFILGGRIKNESEEIKHKILKKAEGMKDGDAFVIKKDGLRLVITFLEKRKKKDIYNRERGVRRLRQRMATGQLTKQHINNRGYNKFLSMDGKVKVAIDEKRIEADKAWDGLKGYITNTSLSPKRVAEEYGHLWQIEKAFRISKTDLKIRPIYHRLERRIESHICIAFVAYAIYKELERLLKKAKIDLSPQRAAELTHNMYEIEYTLPQSKKRQKSVLKMDPEQLILYETIKKR